MVHVGYSFDSGHYVAYCRHSDDGNNGSAENAENMWNLFNDDVVYPRTWGEVVTEISSYGTSPYLAVYRRVSSLPAPNPSALLPSYLGEIPSIDEYDMSFMEEAEASNDRLLREVDTAPFILNDIHAKLMDV